MDTEPVSPSADLPAEVAFRLGCQALETREQDARQLFEEAVRGSGPQMLWRVAQACLETDQSAYWMRRAVVTESEPGGITVDPGVLPILGGNGEAFTQHWKIAVQSDDPAQAIEALNAAELRLPYVLENGRELSVDVKSDLSRFVIARSRYWSSGRPSAGHVHAEMRAWSESRTPAT
ncbi:hypothetical protein [Streptomyces umbrinus]|uniref:hypothetical protein n=1 Tax=Streptomyces umbrinus TaxID=67370 RepID=UPI00167B031D|nr:hypothetical protein [Streptomyces umbrinus]